MKPENAKIEEFFERLCKIKILGRGNGACQLEVWQYGKEWAGIYTYALVTTLYFNSISEALIATAENDELLENVKNLEIELCSDQVIKDWARVDDGESICSSE